MSAVQTKNPLTGGPMLKNIILFSIPLCFTSLLQLFFNAADVVVVGRFSGSLALAAVGSTSSLVNLLVNLFVGISVGANVACAKAYGAEDPESMRHTMDTALLLALGGGVLLSVVGFFGAGTMLRLMSNPEDVIGLATLYLKIFFLGMPANMLYNFSAALLRSVGDTKRPLYCLAFSGVVNVVLNLFFVICLQMSVAGVALATIISQTISAVLVLRILLKGEGPLKLELRKIKLHLPTLRRILYVGLPAGLQGTLFSISNVVIQSSVNSFGSTVLAGNSAAISLEGFVYVAMNAFAQACVTFVSANIGAGHYDNIDRVVRHCLACVTVSGLVLGCGMWVAGAPMVRIYTSDEAAIAVGVLRLAYICRFYLLCGLMDVMASAMRGLGYSVLPMVVSLMGSCVLRLVWIATVFQLVRTPAMLYVSYPISWALTFAVHLGCFAVVRRKLPRTRTESAA